MKRQVHHQNLSHQRSDLTARKACERCNGEHRLDQCNDFKRLNISARVKFITDNNLCYIASDPTKTESAAIERSAESTAAVDRITDCFTKANPTIAQLPYTLTLVNTPTKTTRLDFESFRWSSLH